MNAFEMGRPLRVLLLTRHFAGRSVVPIERGGGTETFIKSVLALPAQMPELAIDVVAPLPEGGANPDPSGVNVHYFSAQSLVQWLFVFRNARNPIANVILLIAGAFTLARHGVRQATRERYDLVYAVGGPIAGLAGIAVKAIARIPLAMHFQYAYAFSKSNAIFRRVVRSFYNAADVVIGNCPTFVADSTALGVPASKCKWVLNWADQKRFKPRDDRAELRKELRLLPEQTAFLFVGRLDWTKHADRIIDALRDFTPPAGAVFLFAGSGELQPQLEELARGKSGIRVLGTVDSERLAELHNACDVQFWGSCDIDYPSLAVMEAMSSGLPVVTSRRTFSHLYVDELVKPEVLGEPRYARHYEPDRAGIRRAINETTGDRSFVGIREDVARFAREHFGVSNARRLVQILSDTAAAKREAPASRPEESRA